MNNKPQGPRGRMSVWKGIAIIAIILGVVWLLTVLAPSSSERKEEIEISQVVAMAEDGQIRTIEVKGDNLTITSTVGKVFKSRKEPGTSILELFEELGIKTGKDGIKIKVTGTGEGFNFWKVLLGLLPVIVIIGFFLFMMSRVQPQGGVNAMIRSKAKLVAERPAVTFNDVAGVEEAKQEVQEVVEFLKLPERFLAMGARIPKGVLLVGAPGTGKTLLARAIAGEAGVPFFHISGSAFVEMFVGMGAARVRDLFDQAKGNAPCIIFIDEIDAVGRHRGAGLGSGHDEREQTLNQILVEMDGFDTRTNVIVLAATNRPDILDPALLRPGRFDRRVTVDLPDAEGRADILKVHMRGKPVAPDVDIKKIAQLTYAFSGADLANLVNEAAILATRQNRKVITFKDFAETVDRVVAGPARKSRKVSKREKEIAAYHEAGHAVVAWKMKYADPVHKISIVQRGGMGGYTRMLPEEDRGLVDNAYLLDNLAIMLGGRVSEAVQYGEEHVTTGASDDIAKATQLARDIITRFAMSKLGLRTFGQREELVFLGREIHERRDYSEDTAKAIDEEVLRLISGAKKKAEEAISAEKERIKTIVKILLDQETLEGELLEGILPPRAPETPA